MIIKPWYVCTSELIMLLLTGTASGNVSAYDVKGNKFTV